MGAVVDAMDYFQSKLDWWVGPIGWLLPDADEWGSRTVQAAGTTIAVEVGLRTYGHNYLYGTRPHWFTGTPWSREIVKKRSAQNNPPRRNIKDTRCVILVNTDSCFSAGKYITGCIFNPSF